LDWFVAGLIPLVFPQIIEIGRRESGPPDAVGGVGGRDRPGMWAGGVTGLWEEDEDR
jgi:hypothetical protein